MIAENTTSRPVVPVDPWQPRLKVRLGNRGVRALSRLSGSLSAIFGNRSPETFGILMYHRVASITENVPSPTFNVAPEQFREQLTGLRDRGFKLISLRQALTAHSERQSLPAKSVVITFDDCFETVFTQAWPILKEMGIPATLFLSTAYLDSESPFPFDTWGEEFADQVPADHYRPLRTEQCSAMAESGLIELGTHTHTHADFRRHTDEFFEEMQISAEFVKGRFGVACPCFSLPFGSPSAGYASPSLLGAARESGAACALTTEAVLVDVQKDPFGWGRFNVFEWDTSATLAGKLNGWYDWAPRLKHRVRSVFAERMKS